MRRTQTTMAGLASTTTTRRPRARQQTGLAAPSASGHRDPGKDHGRCRAPSQPAICMALDHHRVPAVAEADRLVLTVLEATDRPTWGPEADLARDAPIRGTAGLAAPTAGTACRTSRLKGTVAGPEVRWVALMEDPNLDSLLLGHHRGLKAPVAQEAQEVLEVLAVIRTGWALSPSKADHPPEESTPGDLLQDMDLQGLRAPATALDLVPTESALLLRDLRLRVLVCTAQAQHQAPRRLRPSPRRGASRDLPRLKTWAFRRVNKMVIV